MRVKNSIPDFWDGNLRTVFPGIPGKSWEFPGSGIPGILLLHRARLVQRSEVKPRLKRSSRTEAIIVAISCLTSSAFLVIILDKVNRDFTLILLFATE